MKKDNIFKRFGKAILSVFSFMIGPQDSTSETCNCTSNKTMWQFANPL